MKVTSAMLLNHERSNDLLFIKSSNPCGRHRSRYLMAGVFVGLIIVGYMFFQSSPLFLKPVLLLDSPKDGATVRENVVVRGMTEIDTRVYINDYETYSDENGAFSALLPMAKGFQVIDVRVRNKIGKESNIVRQVIVQ